jgi:hypothetical protein
VMTPLARSDCTGKLVTASGCNCPREPHASWWCPTGMRCLAAFALVAFATAGCLGSSGSGAPSGSAAGPPQTVVGTKQPRASVVITYALPLSEVSACPAVTRCSLTHGPGQASFMLIGRRLTCSPATGDYADPRAACRALSDVVTKLGTKNWVCGCLSHQGPPAKAVGYYDGNRRTIPLDGCSLCNLPGIGADLGLLLPGP